MTKYVYRNGDWFNKETGERMDVPEQVAMPMVQSDYPAYYSHASGKMIEGRRARRDDLARTGCRPFEPDEGPKYATSEKWAKRLGLEHNPEGGRPKHWPKDFTGKRIDTTPKL